MLKRSTTRAVVLAGAVTLALAIAAPAYGALAEWYAGPAAMSSGMLEQIAVGNPESSPTRSASASSPARELASGRA
jgi:hypothetical protein